MPLVSFLSYRPARFPQSAIANNDRQVFVLGASLKVIARHTLPTVTRTPKALLVRDRAPLLPISPVRAQTTARISSSIKPTASAYANANARVAVSVLHSVGRSALRRRLLPRQASLNVTPSITARDGFLNVRLPVAAPVKMQASTWGELIVHDRRAICKPGLPSYDTIGTPVQTLTVIDSSVLNRTYSKLVVY